MPLRPVLVVDDDAVSRHVLSSALSGAQIPHLALASGAEAVARIQEIGPSLVLLDLVMPPPDGYEVLRRLRSDASTRELPVVVLTAVDGDEEVARAFAAGADDFVRKPFKPAELIARIRGQLRLRGAIVELDRKQKDAQLLLDLTQSLASILDLRGILDTVVTRVSAIANVARTSVVFLREPRPDADSAFVVATSDDALPKDRSLRLSEHPELRGVLLTNQPFVGPDPRTLQADAASARGMAVLPLLHESSPMGALILHAREGKGFAPEDLDLLRTVANATAIALRNARVLQAMRDQTQQVAVARFEAERRLRTLQRYADFFESGAEGIFVIDTEGHLLLANPKAQMITGYTEVELRGNRIGNFFIESDAALARELSSGFARGRYPQGVDVHLRAKDGRILILSVNFSSVLREEDAVVCSFRDVTADRVLEAELLKTKEFLQKVIDSSADAIISADNAGRVLLVNRAAERISGRTGAEMLAMNVRELYPDDGARRIMAAMQQGGGRVDAMRTEILDTEGHRLPVALSATLLYEGDAVVGSVGVFTDLRERMRMEQRLQHAQEQLLAQERQAVIAELAGAAAHELNQPLTSVMGYAEMLKRRLDKGTATYGAAEVIFNEAERMAEIVRKIGKITKYETKTYVGRARILDLDKASEEEALSSTTRE